MEPKEIFELVIKAAERLKYATTENTGKRREQARDLVLRARAEAESNVGVENLVARTGAPCEERDHTQDSDDPDRQLH